MSVIDSLQRASVCMRPIAEQLADWFPQSQAEAVRTPTVDEAHRYCRELATGHYENFPLVSWLLPPSLHQHFYNVYAFCRWSDDLGDELGDRTRSQQALQWWRGELSKCYAGEGSHPVFVALRGTVERFQIPAQPFHDLITAFEQDQVTTEYATFDDVRGYCRCSADPVGRIVLYLCEQFTEQHALWSDSICTGLQLANFWQDVSRDLDIGRIYLPREDCERFGYSFDELRRRVTNDCFIELMRFEVERARNFLIEGLPLIECLPGRLQVDIDLFARGGLCILERIQSMGYGVLERRPIVKKSDVLRLFMGSATRALGRALRLALFRNSPRQS